VPLWHDSEVAAIAYAIQNIIARRNGEPVAALATPPAAAASAAPTMAGAKCPECGAHAMIRKDGCDFCTQCGHVGACG
jgi:ribonucleoside-diphosphate reductase alpha chain